MSVDKLLLDIVNRVIMLPDVENVTYGAVRVRKTLKSILKTQLCRGGLKITVQREYHEKTAFLHSEKPEHLKRIIDLIEIG